MITERMLETENIHREFIYEDRFAKSLEWNLFPNQQWQTLEHHKVLKNSCHRKVRG